MICSGVTERAVWPESNYIPQLQYIRIIRSFRVGRLYIYRWRIRNFLPHIYDYRYIHSSLSIIITSICQRIWLFPFLPTIAEIVEQLEMIDLLVCWLNGWKKNNLHTNTCQNYDKKLLRIVYEKQNRHRS